MPATVKYQNISSELKKRISEGFYTDTLPSRRELMQEFSVSSRTMHKVFVELKNMNCIIPSSHGTLINAQVLEQAKYPPRIVIAARTIKKNIYEDIFHRKLTDFIRKAGFELLLCPTSTDSIEAMITKHALNSNDAVIFTYSSFQVKDAELLKKHHIPFVSANRPPENIQINWVDWDHMELFNDFVGNMIMLGARSVDIFWLTPTAGLQDNYAALMHDFRAVKRSYSLFNRELDSFPEKFWGNEEKYADHLCSLKKLPDVVWVLNKSRNRLAELLNARGISDTGFLVTHNRSCSLDNSVAFYSDKVYSKLANRIWQLLCYVRRHPDAPPRGLKQRCEVKFYEYKYKQLAARISKTA